jgi:hypothetical protein
MGTLRTALHYEFHELENGKWGGLLPDVSAMELWVDIDEWRSLHLRNCII